MMTDYRRHGHTRQQSGITRINSAGARLAEVRERVCDVFGITKGRRRDSINQRELLTYVRYLGITVSWDTLYRKDDQGELINPVFCIKVSSHTQQSVRDLYAGFEFNAETYAWSIQNWSPEPGNHPSPARIVFDEFPELQRASLKHIEASAIWIFLSKINELMTPRLSLCR